MGSAPRASVTLAVDPPCAQLIAPEWVALPASTKTVVLWPGPRCEQAQRQAGRNRMQEATTRSLSALSSPPASRRPMPQPPYAESAGSWMLSFKPTFPLSFFTFIKMLFSSSLLSAIRVVSSAYLPLLTFLPEILIPACASSSPVFRMMYSAQKLNKQGDNLQPWHTPFPIWNQSLVPRLVLTVASWPEYRLHRRQVRCSGIPGIPISFRIFHSLLWSTQSKPLA